MTAPPRNPVLDTPLSSPVQRFSVFTRDGDFFDGDTFDEDPNYRFERITLTSGGARLDTAEFTVVQTEKGLHDVQTPLNFSRAVEIRLPHEKTDEEDAGIPEPVLFRGELGICTHALSNAGQEDLTAKGRAEQWYLGEPITGYEVAVYVPAEGEDPEDWEYRIIEDSIVFNPEIDERVTGNRSDHYRFIGDPEDLDNLAQDDKPKRYSWIDPESVRTSESRVLQNQQSSDWFLHQAVMSLCWLLNPDETRVKNPDYYQSKKTLGMWGKILNVEIPRGLFLSSALDLLLNPFGFSWYINHEMVSTFVSLEDDPIYEIESRIVIYKRGEGPEKEIKLQPWGEDKDIAKTNHAASNAEWNICDLANIVTVYGAHYEAEGTFELYRAWSEENDVYTADDLEKSKLRSLDEEDEEDEVLEQTAYERHPRVWRDWVLNEAGDYNGTRTIVRPIENAFDLNNVKWFDSDGGFALGTNNVFRRRRFYPPLSLQHDNTRRDVLVEYYEPPEYGSPDPGVWKTVQKLENGHFELLEHECGIRFVGTKPPWQLVDLGANARVRITACLRSDQRIKYETERAEFSPNGNDVKMVVNAETQFFRKIRLGADAPAYRSRYTETSYMNPIPDADTVDNLEQIQRYANALLQNEYPARVSVSVTLEGYRPEYKRGDLITKIAGREISFDQNAKDAPTRRYPQVTEIVYTPTTTELTLEVFDDVAARGAIRAFGGLV